MYRLRENSPPGQSSVAVFFWGGMGDGRGVVPRMLTYLTYPPLSTLDSVSHHFGPQIRILTFTSCY